MIGRDAGLSAVEKFSEHDASCGKRNIGALIDNTRAFPAKLKDAGGQMLGRAAKHLLADVTASREEDKVEFFLKQGGVFLSSACDGRDVLGRKAFPGETF